MNLTIRSLTSTVVITLQVMVLLLSATAAAAKGAATGATAKQPVAARQLTLQRRRQNTCQGKYSIGGTADMVIADGTLVYPDSKDQCQYGVLLLAEGDEIDDIRIKCCVKKTCGKDFIGVCQDKHKNCKGSIIVYVFYFFIFVLFWKKERKEKKRNEKHIVTCIGGSQWKGHMFHGSTQNSWVVPIRNDDRLRG